MTRGRAPKKMASEGAGRRYGGRIIGGTLPEGQFVFEVQLHVELTADLPLSNRRQIQQPSVRRNQADKLL